MANYKKASVVVVAESTGTQSITNAVSAAPLQFTETTDQINYANTASAFDGMTFTTPYTGFYQIAFSLYWGNNAQTAGFVAVNRMSDFAVIALLITGAMGAGEMSNAARVIKLTKGDQIRLYCAQTSGADRIPTATLSIVRMGNAS
jgi:hypothetical protein